MEIKDRVFNYLVGMDASECYDWFLTESLAELDKTVPQEEDEHKRTKKIVALVEEKENQMIQDLLAAPKNPNNTTLSPRLQVQIQKAQATLKIRQHHQKEIQGLLREDPNLKELLAGIKKMEKDFDFSNEFHQFHFFRQRGKGPLTGKELGDLLQLQDKELLEGDEKTISTLSSLTEFLWMDLIKLTRVLMKTANIRTYQGSSVCTILENGPPRPVQKGLVQINILVSRIGREILEREKSFSSLEEDTSPEVSRALQKARETIKARTQYREQTKEIIRKKIDLEDLITKLSKTDPEFLNQFHQFHLSRQEETENLTGEELTDLIGLKDWRRQEKLVAEKQTTETLASLLEFLWFDIYELIGILNETFGVRHHYGSSICTILEKGPGREPQEEEEWVSSLASKVASELLSRKRRLEIEIMDLV